MVGAKNLLFGFYGTMATPLSCLVIGRAEGDCHDRITQTSCQNPIASARLDLCRPRHVVLDSLFADATAGALGGCLCKSLGGVRFFYWEIATAAALAETCCYVTFGLREMPRGCCLGCRPDPRPYQSRLRQEFDLSE